nr:hypothetical protein Iba_chr05fCG6470 [Ipomoea batatas]GME17540.1 hypothetical protein Iba_scaffold18920CG0520 [Ipomoea batatas]
MRKRNSTSKRSKFRVKINYLGSFSSLLASASLLLASANPKAEEHSHGQKARKKTEGEARSTRRRASVQGDSSGKISTGSYGVRRWLLKLQSSAMASEGSQSGGLLMLEFCVVIAEKRSGRWGCDR